MRYYGIPRAYYDLYAEKEIKSTKSFNDYLEGMRKKLKRKLRKCNYKNLSKAIGIDEWTLRRFIDGATPQGKTQEVLIEYLVG